MSLNKVFGVICLKPEEFALSDGELIKDLYKNIYNIVARPFSSTFEIIYFYVIFVKDNQLKMVKPFFCGLRVLLSLRQMAKIY
jgi:hypothetical protein